MLSKGDNMATQEQKGKMKTETKKHDEDTDVVMFFLISIAILLTSFFVFFLMMENIAQYPISLQTPISLQVAYPNHTITQNCTIITTSSQGGHLMDPKNTIQCNFPPSMINNIRNNPFNCSITNKTILTCVGSSVWEGRILSAR
jgi:hypothetical protein